MRYKTRHGRLGGPGILVLLPFLIPFFFLSWLARELSHRRH